MFLHMFWNCPVISDFWVFVNAVLSDVLEVFLHLNPGLCLLNDTSDMSLKWIQRKMLQDFCILARIIVDAKHFGIIIADILMFWW